MRVLPDVQGLVPHHIPQEGEALPALRAAVGPLARVHGLVHLQAARLREALPAHAAAKGPLPRVDAHVALDVAGLGEVFPAHAAAERLLRRRRVEPLSVELLQVEEGLAEMPRVGAREGRRPARELTPGARRGVPVTPPV